MVRFAVFLFTVLFTVPAGAAPFISEFMASNKRTLSDVDGEASDWVEIHNPDSEPVNLDGWYLTDNASNLTKWRFPAVTIPAKGYLVVFCSNKNRRVPGQELHTNFALGAGGEYLGLVAPDGVTRVSEFAPQFPEQFEDISYGVSSSTQTVAMAQDGTMVKVHVPTSAVLGATWRDRTFNDSGWSSSPQPVGYFNVGKTSNPDLSALVRTDIRSQMANQARGAYLRLRMEIPDPASVEKITLRMRYDDGFAAFVNGQWVASGNAPAVNALAFNSFSLGVHNPNTSEEFNLSSAIPHLVKGTNILAIHGLNESATSSDAFFFAELSVVMDTGVEPITGYFASPTPGARNGGPESIRLPQTVAFSRPSGIFTSSFSLVLTGASAGQEIRYNIASPSGSPAAAIPVPTLSSTRYTGPISISSNRIIRAAVFNPVTGQRGEVATMHYAQLETSSTNNTSNFTSTLPIIVADNHGDGEPVDSSTQTYTTTMFHLFEPVDGVAALNRTPNVFTRAGMRVRGKSSQGFPKKNYRLETWNEADEDRKLSLLGLAEDGDWILHGPWGFDDTYIHNAFMHELGRQTGAWTVRTKFVEMFLNSNGGKLDYSDYAGVYLLMERIESGKDRLDIESIGPQDNAGDALTGGYIFKWDPPDAHEVSWKTTHNVPSEDSSMILVEPSPEEDTEEQINYIKGVIQTFENTLFAERDSGFATRNYLKYIDRASWIDFHILNFFSFNPDAVRLSTYFHKNRNGKIKWGPLWDFDRTLGSDDGRDVNPRTWGSSEITNRFFVLNWSGPLYQDPEFVQAWVDRWWDLRGNVLSNANLNALADALGAQIGNTIGARDALKWQGSGRNGNAPISGTHSGEIARMKAWMTSTNSLSLGRAPWLDTQIPGPPAASRESGVVASGSTVVLSGPDTIYYRTDGMDPRPYGGAVTTTSPAYSAPLVINQTTVLTARRRGNFTPFPAGVGTRWSAPLVRVWLVNEVFAEAGDIEVSEIHFRPTAPSAEEKAAVFEPSANDFEYLELRNVGSRVVNTFEMEFVEGKPFRRLKLAPLSLAPGEIALVVRDRDAFQARYGTALNSRIVGEWGRDGSLSNEGEEIQLLARNGSVVLAVAYEPGNAMNASLTRIGEAWVADAPSPGSFGPTYAQWKSHYFPDGADDGDEADPDADRAGNRREYTRGTNPLVADSAVDLEPTLDMVNDGTGRNYRLRYKRPINRPDARLQVEKTTDFVTWEPLSDAAVSTKDGLETREVIVSMDGAGEPASLFLRVRESIAP